jgi:myotubularin-related protein 1/2
LSFGHKFAERIGHGDPNAGDTERAPIFTQWLVTYMMFLHIFINISIDVCCLQRLDAVWQLIRQFPTSFEFNEAFLRELFDQVSACRFGTFLFNSSKERFEAKTAKETPSIWTYLLAPGNRHKVSHATYLLTRIQSKQGLLTSFD